MDTIKLLECKKYQCGHPLIAGSFVLFVYLLAAARFISMLAPLERA